MSASRRHSRSGDRFYNQPAPRRQVQQQQNRNRQSCFQPASIQRTNTLVDSGVPALPSIFSPYSTPGCDLDLVRLTNLDRFLKFTTPLVAGKKSSEASTRAWGTHEDESQTYFVLNDLWDSLHPWSAFGAAVPVSLNGGGYVQQYYAPYLSGIQLYTNPSMPAPRNSSRLGEESDADSARKYLVEGSRQGISGLHTSNKPSNLGISSDEDKFVSSKGVLKFEYYEANQPSWRETLSIKMCSLASQFPELNTYKSCDLSPASWISVAWYPIYRIPPAPAIKTLGSCFLTYHTLSTPNSGATTGLQCVKDLYPRMVPEEFNMALPTFGLSAYKYNAALWEDNGAASSTLKAKSLCKAAEDWLQSWNIDHPDYTFFEGRNSGLRR